MSDRVTFMPVVTCFDRMLRCYRPMYPQWQFEWHGRDADVDSSDLLLGVNKFYSTLNIPLPTEKLIAAPFSALSKSTSNCDHRASQDNGSARVGLLLPHPPDISSPTHKDYEFTSMTPNPHIVLSERPGYGELPVVGKHIILDSSRRIDLDNVPLNGGFLTKTLILSPEPSMRERMRDPRIDSYTTTFTIGAPLVGPGIVVVLRSEKDDVKVGDYMYGQTPWEAYTVQPYVEGRVDFKPEEWAPDTFDMDSLALRVVPNPNGMYPLSKYISLLGTPGLTAFVGFEGLVDAKEGNTIFVSSGASGVGSMVVQLAKLRGMKVIASAGTSAKVEYMRSLGADFPFNYKKQSYESALAQYGPINVFWDNVGGEALDAALNALVPKSRAIICGVVSSDNVPPAQRYRLKNTHLIMKKRLELRGFIVPEFIPQFIGKFLEEVPALMGQGKLKSEECATEGIENAPQALIDMLKGRSDAIGKPIIVVAKE